jgi:hypothetical protein
MERSGGRTGRVLICLNVGVVETARGGAHAAYCRPIAGTLESCQCFARRVNLIATALDVATRRENALSIKGPPTVHGVVFRFLFWPRPALAAPQHRLTFAHTQHASVRLWKPAPP